MTTLDLKYHICLTCPFKVNVNILITKKVTLWGDKITMKRILRISMFGNFPFLEFLSPKGLKMSHIQTNVYIKIWKWNFPGFI